MQMKNVHPQRIVMVKKRLKTGEPCKKCGQVEEMLRRRGLWDQIDEVVWADENDPQSLGMLIAQEHNVELAPFFIVENGEERTVVLSVIELSRKFLVKPALKSGASTQSKQTQLSRQDVESAAESLSGAGPVAALRWVSEKLGTRCAIAFSGAEDVILIDMAVKAGLTFSVFCLDTGRLHPQTYRFIDKVSKFYGIQIDLVSPQAEPLQSFVKTKGLFSFYDDGHKECCGVRKLEPLRRVLAGRPGWITGQRRDQSPTRSDVPELTWDESHDEQGMVKANPLAGWTQQQVWGYIRSNEVPYNELHDDGFSSIGCEPCTRALRPGEHERAARWWWEESTARECGLHVTEKE